MGDSLNGEIWKFLRWENEEFPQISPEYENFPRPPVAPVATFCRSAQLPHAQLQFPNPNYLQPHYT